MADLVKSGAPAAPTSNNNIQTGPREGADLTDVAFNSGAPTPAPENADGNDPNIDFYGEDADEGDSGTEDDDSEEVSDDEEEGDTTDDGGDESDDSEDDSESEDEGSESDSDNDAESDDESEKEAKKEKRIPLTFGDEDYPVPLDATLPVTVNGEVEQASLKDMRDAYASKSTIRKELAESKAAKEEISVHRRKMLRDLEKKEVALIDKEHTQHQAREYLKKGQFEGALNELFEYDHNLWNQFDDLMSNYYSKFAGLSAAEKRAIQLDRQNVMMNAKTQRATQATSIQAAIDKLNQYKAARCEQAGLTEDEVEDAWDSIVDRANKGEIAKAQIDWLEKASPEQKWDTAAAEAVAGKTRSKIKEVIKKQFPKLENKQKDIIAGLEDNLSGKFLIKATKEELAKIIARDYNGGKVDKTTKKVATTNSLRDKAQPRHKLREAATQEDDDDLYAQDERGEPRSQVWGGQFSRY